MTIIGRGIGNLLSSWEIYALVATAVVGFILQQSALKTGLLAPAMASSNAVIRQVSSESPCSERNCRTGMTGWLRPSSAWGLPWQVSCCWPGPNHLEHPSRFPLPRTLHRMCTHATDLRVLLLYLLGLPRSYVQLPPLPITLHGGLRVPLNRHFPGKFVTPATTWAIGRDNVGSGFDEIAASPGQRSCGWLPLSSNSPEPSGY